MHGNTSTTFNVLPAFSCGSMSHSTSTEVKPPLLRCSLAVAACLVTSLVGCVQLGSSRTNTTARCQSSAFYRDFGATQIAESAVTAMSVYFAKATARALQRPQHVLCTSPWHAIALRNWQSGTTGGAVQELFASKPSVQMSCQHFLNGAWV
jgi:hypothetical protein